MTIHRHVYHCMHIATFALWSPGRRKAMSNRIQSIAIPGLGTGIGQVAPMVCARQMRLAWEDVVHEKVENQRRLVGIAFQLCLFFHPQRIRLEI